MSSQCAFADFVDRRKGTGDGAGEILHRLSADDDVGADPNPIAGWRAVFLAFDMHTCLQVIGGINAPFREISARLVAVVNGQTLRRQIAAVEVHAY